MIATIRSFILLMVLLLLLNCAPKEVRVVTYPSNVDLIASSIQKLELPDWRIPKGDKATLVSIEYGDPVDTPVNYLIEDQLIEKLHKMGVTVLERDPEVIKDLFSESGNKYTFYNPKLLIPDSAGNLKGFPLSTADKIIAYRVLECGLKYLQVKYETDKVERNACTVLHVRIENTRSGIVEWVGTLKGEVTDEVPVSALGDLERKDLIFYEHGLPNRKLEGGKNVK